MKNSIAIFLFLIGVNALALTEQDFVKKVLNQDANFEKDQIYVTIKQIELDASRDSYADWNTNLTASVSNSYYDIEKDTTSTKLYEKHRLKSSKSIGIVTRKKFLSNPSVLTIKAKRSIPNTDITRYKQDKIYTGKNAEYNITTFDNIYTISYKYPLLKHDGNAESLKTYHRDILDLKREKLDFDDAQEKFLVDRLKQYIDWNSYQKKSEIYQNYRQSLKAIKANQLKGKLKLNTVILRASQDASNNNAQLQSLKKALVVALNDPSLWSEKPRINTDKRPKILPDLTQYLRHNVRALLKLEIDKRLKEIDLAYHNNQSLYKLDFSISAEKNDNKGNTMTTKYQSESILYTAGLKFSMPIGADVDNQKNVRVAKLNLRKLNIDYDNKLNDINSDAQALVVGLELTKKALDDYQKLRVNVENEVNLAFKEYLDKAITIEMLIDVYHNKRDVELDYIAVLADYQKNLLAYNNKLDRVLPDTR
ncbi:hypothetical protein [uncultured Gammaproteobacteria bacterium]|uniref:TolC family protein n=1 Tax=Bathymodiolus heckerae thiotrophic gill symbiont TaxID=1052212 RepID=UPI0010B37879|nr:TolC family protein [Bathymodiolus heckerae thiotrophic gill symbiont]CAC9455819.1 hypothetical protein [uncultured Gammaproteobacteria bacterium]SMN13498.1 Channel-tunnel spanning the outer membrane and periplasm segregation of daughter chromosomes [Bathymodiolus heckerae thiotrophic gill symbiont]